MTGKRPTDPIGDTVRALFRPASPTPTLTDRVRVALLYSDKALNQAINESALEITYSHTPKHIDEKLDFAKIPAFDLVVANLPDDSKAKIEAFRYVTRYLYVRRPVSFALFGERNDAEFLNFALERTWRMGYRLSVGNALPATPVKRGADQAFIVGTLEGYSPGWPLGFTQGADDSNRESDEGPDGSLDKYQELSGLQRVDGLPVLTVGKVIEASARPRGEDDPYFDEGES